jgi:hypothetical protein
MQIRPMGAELFYADGQTDMTKLIVAFRNFVKAPKSDEIFCSFMFYMRKLLLKCARHFPNICISSHG